MCLPKEPSEVKLLKDCNSLKRAEQYDPKYKNKIDCVV